MKFFKKIALLALACITCFTFGLIAACDENDSSTSSSSSSEEAPAEYVYTRKRNKKINKFTCKEATYYEESP